MTDENKKAFDELSKAIMDKLNFLAWAEKTHPAYLNNLKRAYERVKEAQLFVSVLMDGEQ